MDLEFILFKAFPALKFIFKIDYIPCREDFKELTMEQYDRYYKSEAFKNSSYTFSDKMVALIPENPANMQKIIDVEGKNLVILSESEMQAFESATNFINKFIKDSGKDILCSSDKLKCLAEWIPDTFTKGTPYEIYSKK